MKKEYNIMAKIPFMGEMIDIFPINDNDQEFELAASLHGMLIVSDILPRDSKCTNSQLIDIANKYIEESGKI